MDENFTRLITTFDEVRHFFHARTYTLQVLHLKPACRLHKNSVRPRNVRPPKSLPATSHRRPSREGRPSQQSSPQGLRRPRFSFFRFTCQTARDLRSPPLRRTGEPSKLHTSDRDRKLGSPNISEVLRRRDIAPRGGRRAVWVLYSLAAGGLSTPKPET